MRIDFTRIESGEEFELLCEDLLQAMGFTVVQQPARGPEGGKDLIVGEVVRDKIGFAEERKWLVQCKHYAQSGRAVGFKEVANYRDAMDQYKVQRYLLITSTLPTEDLRVKFEATSRKGDYVAITWSKGDLARLLDEHPEVRNRYFPSEEVAAATPVGELADTVEGLLAVMGFACQSRQQTAARRVSLVCQGSGPFAQRMLVGCKEGEITSADVEGAAQALQGSGISNTVLISQVRVSPAAREKAGSLDAVRAVTLSAFYRELIDFEPYVRRSVTGYEESELRTYYVDLGCFKLERDAEGQVAGRSEHKPLDDYLDTWLEEKGRNHISILGDYGTGKTSFCRQYAAKLGRRWLADPDHHRIPILISLRDYAKAMNLEQLVTDFLVNRYAIQAGYEAFHRFNADGKLVLLFDGFDEMAQQVDYQTTVNNFEELARVVVAGSKVLLTCRTPYFRTSDEAWDLFSREYEAVPEAAMGRRPGGMAEGAPEQPLIDLRDRPNFEIVHLLPFDDDDIRAVLQARFPDDWESRWGQIEETYNLTELAHRPVLLDMIVGSLPEIAPDQVIDAARLYELYTDLWLERDIAIMRTFMSADDKRLFMQELALEMHRRDELSIHYSQLPERVGKHFGLEKAHEIDYFAHDIRTCSFLNRDSEGNYRFVHKSFQEFFLAQWLAPRLLDGSAPEMRINEEIRGFVHGLLAEALAAGQWPPPPPEGMVVPEGMAWVPPGPFIYSEGEGTRVVRLEQGLFVARAPVTNAEYARFVAATGREPPRHWRGQAPPKELRDHPVVQVSWHDCVAYAEWAGVRLLTEQEWEKAARGIDGRLYPWGDVFDPARCNTRESGPGTTTPVGRYSPGAQPGLVEGGDSPCGCADMAGNVWEWTASEWEPGSDRRVVRGGSFVVVRVYARAPVRLRPDPAYRGWSFGVRVGAAAPFSLPSEL
jgi:formylglycine-generating enzyme required for sulfatase activity